VEDATSTLRLCVEFFKDKEQSNGLFRMSTTKNLVLYKGHINEPDVGVYAMQCFK
jgi:hypothetical protein